MRPIFARPAVLAALVTTSLAGYSIPACAQAATETAAAAGAVDGNEIIVPARRRSETLQEMAPPSA